MVKTERNIIARDLQKIASIVFNDTVMNGLTTGIMILVASAMVGMVTIGSYIIAVKILEPLSTKFEAVIIAGYLGYITWLHFKKDLL